MDYPHGTISRYVSGRCRCEDCRAANAAHCRHRRRMLAYGRWAPLVPAAPARQHLLRLRALGVGSRQMSTLAGYGSNAVSAFLILNPQKMTAAHRDRLLAIRPVLAEGARIDATGTRRRLQALCAVGWVQQTLAEATGLEQNTISRLITHRYSTVMVATARTVADFYEAHSLDGQGNGQGAVRSRRRATALGWAPPLAWDEGDLDDPAGRPTGVRVPEQQRHAADVAEDWEWLRRAGVSPELGAQRLGVSVQYLTETLVARGHLERAVA